MGYLQVRDFPEDLHEELKLLAKKEHRSVSQQTIIAIKEHVARAADRAIDNQIFFSDQPWCDDGSIDYGAKRKKVLEWIAATPKPDIPDLTERTLRYIHEGREERDACIGLQCLDGDSFRITRG